MFACVVSLLVVLGAILPSAVLSPSTVGLSISAVAQIEDFDQPAEETPGLGEIVGSPDAGPEPEDPGDRGGWAQLGLAAVMFAGVAFIIWRIVNDARRGRA